MQVVTNLIDLDWDNTVLKRKRPSKKEIFRLNELRKIRKVQLNNLKIELSEESQDLYETVTTFVKNVNSAKTLDSFSPNSR